MRSSAVSPPPPGSSAFTCAAGAGDIRAEPPPSSGDRRTHWRREAVDAAKLARNDKLFAIRRLDLEARRLERTAGGASFEDLVREERRASFGYGGMIVEDPAAPPPLRSDSDQNVPAAEIP